MITIICMRRKLVIALTTALFGCLTALTLGVSPTAGEFKLRKTWLEERFSLKTTAFPCSFTYSHRPSTELFKSWKMDYRTETKRPDQTQHTLTWTDPETGLSARCEVTEFQHHPAIEWVLNFRNTGARDTAILQEVQVLDTDVPVPAGNAVLHYAKGAVCSMDDFQPLAETLKPGARVHLQPGGGRSSSDFLPFFNIEQPSRGGIVLGLGWSGEWAAEFRQDTQSGTRIKAGMALTHLLLHPGDEIRTPRIALLFYESDWIRGQNLWRRFLLDYHRPQVNGRPLEPPVFNGNWGGTRAADHLANIKAIAAHDLPVEFYWIDAEWFGNGPWWANPGNWRVKQDLYPDSFKPISNLLHESRRKLLLWFEPERVCEGTPWARELGQWLLEVPKEKRCYNWAGKQSFPDWVTSESRRNQIKDGDRLFNLGIPEARRFLTDYISSRITEFGLDCYRHDANIAPLEFWRAADPPDRQGITEIRWVEGLYAFWDELLRRHPHLIIDNCASGGRRIDLETLSRSTPFWRTDFPGNLTAKQCHTYGISFWVPLNATGSVTLGKDSDYTWRSTISSSVVFGLFGNGDAAQSKPAPGDFPYAKAKAILEQYRTLQPCFLGDYYPLTPYSKSEEGWLAWQFHRADLAIGLVQAFRRPSSFYESARFKLAGLEANASFAVKNLDATETEQITGRELMERGLLITLMEKPSSAAISYRQIR